MNNKLYPFSVQKHAHDIEFRLNRVSNEMHDALEEGKEFEKFETLHDSLIDLLEAVLNSRDGRIAYLTGKQIGLAKETIAWASNARASSLIAAGKTQYLHYC